MDPAHLIPDCIDYNAELFELQKQLESEQADLIATTLNLLAAMASELDKMADGNPFASALLNRYHGDAPAMPALTEIDDDFDPFATVVLMATETNQPTDRRRATRGTDRMEFWPEGSGTGYYFRGLAWSSMSPDEFAANLIATGWATLTEESEDQDRITRKIDEAPVLHSSEIEPYDPWGDMEAWGKAYESLDDDCEDGEGE
jgi:hypothetical protein